MKNEKLVTFLRRAAYKRKQVKSMKNNKASNEPICRDRKKVKKVSNKHATTQEHTISDKIDHCLLWFC